MPADDLEELVAGQHQLGDHGHQLFEGIDVDAQGLLTLHAAFAVVLAGSTAAALAAALGHGVLGLDLGGRRPRPAPRRGAAGRPGAGASDHLSLGLAEGPLEVVERDFARDAARAPAPARRSNPSPLPAIAGATGGAATTGAARRLGRHYRRDRLRPWLRSFEIRSPSVAFRLGRRRLSRSGEDLLDAGRSLDEDQRHGLGRSPAAPSPILAHQRLAGMGQRFEPRQPEEAAGALDGVDQPENVVRESSASVGVLLEPHEFHVDDVKALVGFGQEFAQQVIHCRPTRPVGTRQATSRLALWFRSVREKG